jgi:deazaflavin-dependent oxidoreductase (nitroreductase family)
LARFLNRGFAAWHASGLAPAHWVTLEVVGRRSGRTIAFPLVMAVVGGERYLVSMLGRDAAWVRNVRAAGGRAVLRHGAAQPVILAEVPVAERAPVLKAYLQRAPGARPHVPVSKDAPLAAFEAIAERFPVFRVRRAD